MSKLHYAIQMALIEHPNATYASIAKEFGVSVEVVRMIAADISADLDDY